MFTQADAIALLTQAGLFFDVDDDTPTHTLNMNDVWGWACADGERVSDEELVPLATLFFRYGWCGVLYWVSQRNNGMRSEFADNNRRLDFVANEERIRAQVPGSSERAYHKEAYTIGISA